MWVLCGTVDFDRSIWSQLGIAKWSPPSRAHWIVSRHWPSNDYVIRKQRYCKSITILDKVNLKKKNCGRRYVGIFFFQDMFFPQLTINFFL